MKKKTSSFLEYLVLLIMLFFPMLIIGDFSVPTILLLTPLLLINKKKVVKENAKLTLLTTCGLLVTYIPILIASHNDSLKDLAFVAYPALILIQALVLDKVFCDTNKDITKLLKIFIWVQVLFCILQASNFLGTNKSLSGVYEYWQLANFQKKGLWEIASRNFGTIGSPIYLSVVSYLFAKIIQKRTGTNLYIIIALLLTFMAGARLPLIAILLIEMYDKLTNRKISKRNRALFLIAATTLTILAINFVPFINSFFNSYIAGNEDITKNYSFTYREDMLELLKNNGDKVLLGGYGISNFPSYVDNEYILRLLQFGVINYGLILSQYFYMYKKASKETQNKKILREMAVFILTCMLTSNILTNIYMMQFILLSILLINESSQEKENA